MEDSRESREQRAARYRKLAEEAEAFAADSRFPEARDEYLALAKAWRTLARNADLASQ
jgi:hypothetical protein